MRLNRVLMVSLFAATCLAMLSFAEQKPDATAKITALEKSWCDAYRQRDVAAMSSMLAEDFISIGTDGKLTTKSDLMAHLKPGHWERNEISDVKVIVHDNVAVATGLWSGKGQMGDRRIDLTERWTDTWIRTSAGQWQCLASQQTEIKR